MSLIRLSFESTLKNDREPTLAFVLQSGRRNNTTHHITGIALICGNSVFEILEGDSDNVRQTFQRIAADTRHQITRVNNEEIIDRPYFSKWNIGYRRNDHRNHNEHSWKDGFFFDGTDGWNSRGCPAEVTRLLEEFAQNHPITG